MLLDLFRLGPSFIPISYQGYPSIRDEGAGPSGGKLQILELPEEGSGGERRKCNFLLIDCLDSQFFWVKTETG